MDILTARMNRIEQRNRQQYLPIYQPAPIEEPKYEPIKESVLTNKKLNIDDLDYDELIDTIIKKRTNTSTTRKILRRYVEESEIEASDE